MVVDLPVSRYRSWWHISNKLYLKPLWMQRSLKLRDQTHIPGMTGHISRHWLTAALFDHRTPA